MGVSGSVMAARRGFVEWVLGSRSRALILFSASAWGGDLQVAGRFRAAACHDQDCPSHTPVSLEVGANPSIGLNFFAAVFAKRACFDEIFSYHLSIHCYD